MVQQTKKELDNHLKEQLEFLRSSCNSYDNGFEGEAKRIASIIRILLHDTNKSKSLLSLLDMKNTLDFLDSSMELEVPGATRVGGYAGLVSIASNGYVSDLDNGLNSKKVNFDKYWNKTILIDKENKNFTRKNIILYLANKDGGSHVDPKLDKKYAELSRNNSIGWIRFENGKDTCPINGVELATVRQIGHEILKTLIPHYSKKIKSEESGLIIGGAGIYLVTSNNKNR